MFTHNEVYLDNSATTKPCSKAVDKITELLTDNYGNPSSLHSKGLEAEKEITATRTAIADILSAGRDEIYFTSGGTEANNLAIFGCCKARERMGNKIVTTAMEHSSVFDSIRHLENKGFEIIYLKPENGSITLKQLSDAIDDKTVLVSMMYVNNETGLILPVDKVKKVIKAKHSPALFHCDAVQAFGKIPVKPKKIDADLLTVTAHKIHGPKGTGALYIKKGTRIIPRAYGGEQEKRIRPGTEAAPLIAGFGAAVREIDFESTEYIVELNEYLRKQLKALDNIKINSPDNALPYILNFSVPGIRSETMLHFLSSKNIYVSSGSACAKGKKSHVLESMGLSYEYIDSAIRVSFSKFNTIQDIDRLVCAIIEGTKTLVRKKS